MSNLSIFFISFWFTMCAYYRTDLNWFPWEQNMLEGTGSAIVLACLTTFFTFIILAAYGSWHENWRRSSTDRH